MSNAKSHRKWFANRYFWKITLKPVSAMAMSFKSVTPFFDTWQEAHAYLTGQAMLRLAKAKRELPAAKKGLERVKAMKEPQ